MSRCAGCIRCIRIDFDLISHISLLQEALISERIGLSSVHRIAIIYKIREVLYTFVVLDVRVFLKLTSLIEQSFIKKLFLS